MSVRLNSASTWLIVEALKRQFAIPVGSVREIVMLSELTAVPDCEPHVRGVINLRGRIIPVIDVRKLFGWQSAEEEVEAFCQLMKQREQDHRNWLKELRRSVEEGVEFGLARDPRKCAFGKWYYSYRPDSPWIGGVLKRFENPHNRIHALASSIEELTKTGRREDALQAIEEATKGVLGEMIALFDHLKDLARSTAQEIAVVFTTPNSTFAGTFDSAIAVENIAADKIEDLQAGSLVEEGKLVTRIMHRDEARSLALVLEPGSLLGNHSNQS